MKIGSQGYSTNQNLFWTVFGFIVLGLILLMVTGTLQYRPQPLAKTILACDENDITITSDNKGEFSKRDKKKFDINKGLCEYGDACDSKIISTEKCTGEFKLNIDPNGEYSEEDIKNLKNYCSNIKNKTSCLSWRVCTWKSVGAETGTCSYNPGKGIKTVSCIGLDANKCATYIKQKRGCELTRTKELVCSKPKGSSKEKFCSADKGTYFNKATEQCECKRPEKNACEKAGGKCIHSRIGCPQGEKILEESCGIIKDSICCKKNGSGNKSCGNLKNKNVCVNNNNCQWCSSPILKEGIGVCTPKGSSCPGVRGGFR